ncbi:hypothetical protein PMIN06_010616 [Paraphaeosphaeria minitans]
MPLDSDASASHFYVFRNPSTGPHVRNAVLFLDPKHVVEPTDPYIGRRRSTPALMYLFRHCVFVCATHAIDKIDTCPRYLKVQAICFRFTGRDHVPDFPRFPSSTGVGPK